MELADLRRRITGLKYLSSTLSEKIIDLENLIPKSLSQETDEKASVHFEKMKEIEKAETYEELISAGVAALDQLLWVKCCGNNHSTELFRNINRLREAINAAKKV